MIIVIIVNKLIKHSPCMPWIQIVKLVEI